MREKSSSRLQISVFGLWRDSESYINKTLSQFESLEEKHDLSYYFYENDSEDKTPTILKKWMKDRKGCFHSETFGDEKYGNKESLDRQKTRDEKMASYRNAMLQLGKKDKVDSEWSMVLDTDIEFKDTIVEDFLACHYKDVIMMTPHIEHNNKCHMCEPQCNKWAYYDSYALRTKENPRRSITFSCNPFWESHNRKEYAKGNPVEVECAFGSISLIKTKALLKGKWGTEGDCEHVFFANSIQKYGKIIVCPTVKAWTEVEPIVPNQNFLEFQKTQVGDPWAQKAALVAQQRGLPHYENIQGRH